MFSSHVVRPSPKIHFEQNYALSFLFRSNVAHHAHAPMRSIRLSDWSDAVHHAHAPMYDTYLSVRPLFINLPFRAQLRPFSPFLFECRGPRSRADALHSSVCLPRCRGPRSRTDAQHLSVCLSRCRAPRSRADAQHLSVCLSRCRAPCSRADAQHLSESRSSTAGPQRALQAESDLSLLPLRPVTSPLGRPQAGSLDRAPRLGVAKGPKG